MGYINLEVHHYDDGDLMIAFLLFVALLLVLWLRDKYKKSKTDADEIKSWGTGLLKLVGIVVIMALLGFILTCKACKSY